MTKLAANLTLMFSDLPFLDRFDAAAAAGFKAVECVAPYEAPAEAVAERLDRNGLELVLFNMGIGDWAAGDRGMAANPERVAEFHDYLSVAATYARATGCKQLHIMPGKIPPEANRAAWTHAFVSNARDAADALADDGIDVMFEPINTKVDIPGYFYDTTKVALELMDAVNRPNVKLQYDIYHMQIMEGDLARTIERLLPRIGHIQIADNPGRNEPGTGEINYPWLLSRLESLGYKGWIGCEYRPLGDTLAGLGWAKPYLA
ncbi:MAG TPA: 2-oxo-tetronate isomerase [Caulobacteraceae bacterium]|nr:2-oxo-tetronate isomerase [Caulobacteraceae bacterium]